MHLHSMILESHDTWQNQSGFLAPWMQTQNLIICCELLQVLSNLIHHLVWSTILKNSLFVSLAFIAQAKDALLWLALHRKWIHDVLFPVTWRHFRFFLFDALFWPASTLGFLPTTQGRQGFNAPDPLSEYFLICEVGRWLAYPPHNLGSFRNIVLRGAAGSSLAGCFWAEEAENCESKVIVSAFWKCRFQTFSIIECHSLNLNEFNRACAFIF